MKSTDVSKAVWIQSGRLPVWKSLGNAILSIVIVAMGAPLGREGAPKQVAAVIASYLSDVNAFNSAANSSSCGLWSRSRNGCSL